MSPRKLNNNYFFHFEKNTYSRKKNLFQKNVLLYFQYIFGQLVMKNCEFSKTLINYIFEVLLV